jgi:hypothetical protein
MWCVFGCDQVKINNLDTCCEKQVEEGRTTKRNETKRNEMKRFLYFIWLSQLKGTLPLCKFTRACKIS